MSQDQARPLTVISLRANDYSSDSKSVTISLKTKHSKAGQKYSVPIECFYDLIGDLERLNAAGRARPIEPPVRPMAVSSSAHDLVDCLRIRLNGHQGNIAEYAAKPRAGGANCASGGGLSSVELTGEGSGEVEK